MTRLAPPKRRNGKYLRQLRGLDVEAAVRSRYSEGARRREKELCCPVNYDTKYLKIIPKEILERDYGCGDPSRYIREGDTVLDLGCGTGKICYIASQIVGPRGRVIGIDFNEDMLALARNYQKVVGDRIGYHNVEFRRGKIQDLALDYELLGVYLETHPVRSAEDYLALESYQRKIVKEHPLVADESIDVVVSNCVLNLVRPQDKEKLFREMFRVLKRGGRVAISDIVSDEEVPEPLQNDPELWSGCISGAFREDLFLKAFEQTGFYGIRMEIFSEEPFRTVEGIEFRSVTVTAAKGKEGPCLERNQAVIYKGPWKEVLDDDQHLLKRGIRTAVCDKTFQIYSKPPYKEYKEDLVLIPPRKEVAYAKAGVFDCHHSEIRSPRETKGLKYKKTTQAKPACEPGGACC